jgi:hypothetical protein
VISPSHNDDEFDIDAAVDEIIAWAGEFGEQRGICPTVLAELLTMAAAKGRILTHWESEHDIGDSEEDSVDDN